jgi:hypothetical protein
MTGGTNVEWQWNQLLDYIESGVVVPVVGSELLWTELRGSTQWVPRYLANELAAKASLASPPAALSNPLGAVVEHYLSKPRSRSWPYGAISHLTRELLAPLEPPPALKQLAELPFPLFVSTTTDNLLERAVNAVRYNGSSGTLVPPYALGSKTDLPDRTDRTIVFPLLGLANPAADYAVTDEDILEFVHQFQATGTPRRLFERLRQSHLLIIGGGFSDWLLRFLVRLVKPGRLWTSRSDQLTLFVADGAVSADARLLEFLAHPLSDTEVFPVSGAAAFVDELHRRWRERHPPTTPGEPVVVPRHDEMRKSGGVFISYCSEDFAHAERVRDLLHSAGLDVWFDKRDLHPGDDYEREIVAQIRSSFFFVAVISRNALTLLPRFFRVEWRAGERRAERAAYNQPYALPVCLDDTPNDHAGIPEFLRKVQWTAAPEGALPESFVTDLVKAYRDIQRAERQG